jgi:peptide-methionine (S)-S-oxide reductase
MRQKILNVFLVLGATALAVSVLHSGGREKQDAHRPEQKVAEGRESLVLGAGCFWCVEPLFEMIRGVDDVEAGYAGGQRSGVSYEEVVTGKSGHAEVVKVVFDPKVVSRADLLRIFMTIHDPTTLNRQGPDEGPHYRSAIFFASEEERKLAESIIAEITREKIWKDAIVTTIEPLKNYTRAEEYHQDYYRRYEQASAVEQMRMNTSYCRIVIEPKVREFQKKFRHLMKG